MILIYTLFSILFALYATWSVTSSGWEPDYIKIIVASIVWPLSIIYITLIYKE